MTDEQRTYTPEEVVQEMLEQLRQGNYVYVQGNVLYQNNQPVRILSPDELRDLYGDRLEFAEAVRKGVSE